MTDEKMRGRGWKIRGKDQGEKLAERLKRRGARRNESDTLNRINRIERAEGIITIKNANLEAAGASGVKQKQSAEVERAYAKAQERALGIWSNYTAPVEAKKERVNMEITEEPWPIYKALLREELPKLQAEWDAATRRAAEANNKELELLKRARDRLLSQILKGRLPDTVNVEKEYVALVELYRQRGL